MHKTNFKQVPDRDRAARRLRFRAVMKHVHTSLICMAAALGTMPANASMFKGEALDTAADVLAWVVLIVAPIIAIAVFLLVHILPEKIAEKRKHPQAKLVQVLCILSLFFGGLLWPIAWIIAYTKPVLHKMAYGTDTVEPEHGKNDHPPAVSADDSEELKRLRTQVAELESRLGGQPSIAERKKD